MNKKQLTGAEIIWDCVAKEDVNVVFGYPGGAILPAYDALEKYRDKIHHVLVRHEQGATHMADGFARASGKVGVAMATSGPGATNMITGLATAMMDSIPIVCITGQVPSSVIGTDAFQEIDITGATIPVTKHNYLVMDINELASTIKEAFHVARSGRPGPVLIDIPKDIQFAKTKYKKPNKEKKLNGKSNNKFSQDQIDELVKLLSKSKKPIIYSGGGVINSGPKASQALRELVRLENESLSRIATKEVIHLRSLNRKALPNANVIAPTSTNPAASLPVKASSALNIPGPANAPKNAIAMQPEVASAT